MEEILYRHPAVLEATVISIPDPYWIERVHAVVVTKAERMFEKGGYVSLII